MLATTGGSLLEAEGTVEFRAHYVVTAGRGRSTRTAGSPATAASWRYLDGVSSLP